MLARRGRTLASVATDAKRRRRGSSLSLSAAAVAAVLVAAFLVTRGSALRPTFVRPPTSTATIVTPTHDSGPVGALPALPHGPTGPAHPAAPAIARAALPADLTIPAIGVSTPLEPLALLPDHTLQSPSRWDEAGWYADGVRPGEPGPAVIIGHVDSVSGPAVFYRLRDLHPGAVALVVLHTGRTLRFVIDTVQVYPKNQFPSAAVYGPTALPELRLITCTGDFDWSARSYVDNLVVTAHLDS
jgi:sortase (surface protein transpeptidase)